MSGQTSNDILILAVESSCDETAASVVKNGRTILSNVISSQIATHTVYGGVVPEIASREHIKAINYVIERALAEVKCKSKINYTFVRLISYGTFCAFQKKYFSPLLYKGI